MQQLEIKCFLFMQPIAIYNLIFYFSVIHFEDFVKRKLFTV